MKKFLIAALVFLSACQSNTAPQPTEDGYRALLNEWLGQEKSALYAVWGEPQHDYWKANTNYVLYIKSDVKEASNGAAIDRMPRIAKEHAFYQSPQGLVTQTCTTLFKVEDGIITSWRFEGNNCTAL